MANVQRHRRELDNPVEVAVDSDTVIEIGDLLWLDTDDAKPAADITLLDIVTVTEESFAMAECFESDTAECPLIDHCALNAALRKALGAFFEVLAAHSLADLVRDRPHMQALLGMEPAA